MSNELLSNLELRAMYNDFFLGSLAQCHAQVFCLWENQLSEQEIRE